MPDENLEPLPCPFCGELPAVLPKNPEKEGNCFGMVACRNPGCSAQPTVHDGETIADERGSDLYKLAAIIRWNKRV